MVGDYWIKLRNDYIGQQLGPKPSQTSNLTYESGPDEWQAYQVADAEWQKKWDELEGQWFQQLPPQQQQDAANAFLERTSSFDSSFKIGKALSLGIIGAVAGGAGLAAMGGAGAGTAAAGTEAAGSGLLGDAATSAAWSSGAGLGGDTLSAMGLGQGSAAAAGTTGAGLLGDAATSAAWGSGAGLGGDTLSAMGAGGADAASAGSALAGLGGAPSTGSGGMDFSSILSGLGDVKDWGSLLAGGAGLANSLRSPETAAPPDYTALAKLQAQLNQEAADKALAANRPDQVDAAGNTLTWTQDPVTGKWTQTQKLSDANQQLLNTSQGAQLDALRGVANRGDFNFQGGSMMDPVGNSKEIQDAWMNLLKPQREMALNGEIQRLKNQGLTEDSPAFQRAMLRQNQADTDAQNKALIAGTSEYSNQFNRSLQGRQQAFGEYQTDYNAPMQQYQGLMGIAQPQGQFGSFTQTQNVGGAPVYNAGQDQYTANLAGANAKNAANNNLTQGLFGLSGAIAKGGWGS